MFESLNNNSTAIIITCADDNPESIFSVAIGSTYHFCLDRPLAHSDAVADRYESRTRDDYTQASNLWRIFSEDEKNHIAIDDLYLALLIS